MPLPIIDQSGKTWNTPDNPAIQCVEYKFGDGSLLQTASTGLIYTGPSADFTMPGDWTMEWYIRLKSTAGVYNQIYVTDSSGAYFRIDFYPYIGYTFVDVYGEDEFGTFWEFADYDIDYEIPINTWLHIAAVKNGATGLFFINGVSYPMDLIGALIPMPSMDEDFVINPASNTYFDEFRFSNGIARYTSNFTPGGPFTMDAYTKILLHFDCTETPQPTAFGQVIIWKRKGSV